MDIWYVYSWTYSNPEQVEQIQCSSKEEAMDLVRKILDRGSNWDAYATQNPDDLDVLF